LLALTFNYPSGVKLSVGKIRRSDHVSSWWKNTFDFRSQFSYKYIALNHVLTVEMAFDTSSNLGQSLINSFANRVAGADRAAELFLVV